MLIQGRLFKEDSLSQMNELVEKQKNRRWKFKNKKLSENCKDLISKMLEPDPSKRITLREIRDHPWFSEDDEDNKSNQS